MRRRIVTTKCLAVPIIAAVVGLSQGVVLAQAVVINGLPLVTTRTPVNVGGSILLPMRDVFEALNSEVMWFASERKIMATRGNTVIQLWLNQRTATINGQPVTLAVAPTLISGSTYVPLRFPAEAFGGNVEWQAATRTAVITIPPAGGPGPVEPPGPPEPPLPPQPPPVVTVEGTVVQIIPNPASIVIAVSGTGLAQAVAVTPTTIYTRHAEGQQPQASTLAAAVPGEYAIATLGPDGRAVSVDFAFGETAGVVAGISENSLLLKDNTLYSLSPTVSVVDQTGKALALSEVPTNAQVTLRYQPVSRTVWQIRVATPTTPPPPTEQPKIIVLGILNDSPLLKAGDVLRIQLQGTPGGVATTSVGRLFDNLAMDEVQPGIYQAEFIVPPNTNMRNVALAGNLTVGAVKARPVSSQVRLSFDSIPPEITEVIPAQDEVVATASPMIEARFDDLGGTPINPASARLTVGGRLVTGDMQVTAERLGHLAEDLPAGLVRAEVAIEDMAGNRVTRSWSFRVGTVNAMITAAWHDARSALTAGQILTVNMRVANPGGTASFDIGGLRAGIPMQRLGTTNTYRGKYTVRAGDRLANALITVSYRDPAGRDGSLDIASRVNVNASLPTALAITAPAHNSRVADFIVVRGQAPPTSQVHVTIRYRVRVVGVITGQLWEGTVVSDGGGVWETPEIGSSTGLFGQADEYFVRAELLDDAGAVVSQKEITLLK